MSVPDVQLLNVQPDRSIEPPAVKLIASALVEPVPVIATDAEILPVPNCAALNVAVDVPDVFVKLICSMFRKPLTPLLAAALRSIAVPAPATPICSVSVPPLPS
ncbi:MAG: hypothetical protein U1E60_00675 [Reyranellaceae bacterium]